MSRQSKKMWHHIAISVLITFLILCCIMLALSSKRESRLKIVTDILNEESVRDFVVRQITSTVVLEKEEKSSIFGNHTGLLMAEVTLHYGFNLCELSEDDIKRQKDKNTVKLGDLKVVKLSVDVDSMRFFNSSMHYFKDKSVDNLHYKEMLNSISSFAPIYFERRKLLPDRQTMLKKLQDQLKLVNTTLEVY